MAAPSSVGIWNQTGGFVGYIQGLNAASNYLFAGALLLTLWIIVIVRTVQYPPSTRFIIASFLCTMVSWGMWVANFAPAGFAAVCCSLLIIFFLYEQFS